MRLFLCLFSVSLALAGCTSNGDPPGTAVGEGSPSPSLEGQPGSAPASNEADGGAPESGTTTPYDAGTLDTEGGSRDAGHTTEPASCSAYAAPTTPATCRGCVEGHVCQVNGCFGGYWCEVTTIKCVTAPAECQ